MDFYHKFSNNGQLNLRVSQLFHVQHCQKGIGQNGLCPKISNNGQPKITIELEIVPIVSCTTLLKRYWTKWTFVPNFQIMDKPNIIELESVPIVPCNNTAKKVLDKNGLCPKFPNNGQSKYN
ncbi:unnamed protein product [Rhizophagus irregularis]|nr:unnamed protein product [Rhizophagus irregularis]